MKLFESKPLFDRYTGQPTGEMEVLPDGIICDACGSELNEDIDDENMPLVSFTINDLGNYESYFHDQELRFTAEQALETFDINCENGVTVENDSVFTDNPFTYCRLNSCLEDILKRAIKGCQETDELWLEHEMAATRRRMLKRVLLKKIYTPTRLGIDLY